MTEKNRDISPERLEDLIADGESSHVASAEARAVARSAFLTGARAAQTGMERAEVETEVASRVVPIRAVVMAALAAALAAFVFVFGSQPGERWSVVDLPAPEEATLQGERASLDLEFSSGLASTTAAGEIDLQLAERLRLKLLPESRAELPEPPGRWFSSERVVRLEAGEVCGTSGGEKLGFKLLVETPEARAEILGTTFAVVRDELGTCIALYEGAIDVYPTSRSEKIRIPETRKIRVYRDGREPEILDLDERETSMLRTMFQAGLLE